MIQRHYCEVCYTTCSRCQRKVPISECVWDAGLLVCKVYDCADRLINGSFEFAVVNQTKLDRLELRPDEKLIHPEDVTLQIQRVGANAGTW